MVLKEMHLKCMKAVDRKHLLTGRDRKENKRIIIEYTKETCALFRGTTIYNEHLIYVEYHTIENIKNDV